jgi:hypothetical protein
MKKRILFHVIFLLSIQALGQTTLSSNSQTACAGTTVNVAANNADPLVTFVWTAPNQTNVNGAQLNLNSVSQNITWTCTTYDATNNPVDTDVFTLTVNALPTVTASPNQTVCSGTNVTLTGGGASSYTWNNGITNGVAFVANATTTYTVTGTDANGCVNTAQTTVTVNALPTVTASPNQTVCSGTNVTLTGGGASNYTWNNGITNGVAFAANATTTYTVTGTDANGCVNTAQVTVSVNAVPTVIAGNNQTVCAGTAVTLSGSGASSYTWNNGVTNATPFTPIATQTYTVTGTAANGCTNTAQVIVIVNALPTVSGGNNQTVCAGTIVTLNGSGATSYVWDNGVTNATPFTPVATQTYTVTGTNANGCMNTAQVTVSVNAVPTVIAGNNQTVCAGTAVTLSGSGASTYSWNNNVQNGVSFTPNTTQTYTVTGTAANGCANTAQVTVTVNALPTVSVGINQTVCAGTAVTLSGSGASTYAWNNNVQNGVAFTPNTTQTYTVTGTAANGCTNTAQVTVTVNALPNVSGGNNQTVCAGAQVTLAGSGASTYSWNNNVQNGVSFTPNTTQTYTVTGTDANGCVNTAQTTVTVNPLPDSTISANGDTVFCSGGNVGLSVPQGIGNVYTWSLNNSPILGGVASSYFANQTGVFSVQIVNQYNCTSNDTITITSLNIPIAVITNTAPSNFYCQGSQVTLNSASNCVGCSLTYQWLDNSMNSIQGANSSTYSYTANSTSNIYLVVSNNLNGVSCVDTSLNIPISVIQNLTPTFNLPDSICVNDTYLLPQLSNNLISGNWNHPSITSQYTSYTFTPLIGQCALPYIWNVTLEQLPSPNLGNDTTICSGEAVNLSLQGFNYYLWNNGSVNSAIQVSPVSTELFIVSVTDNLGCIGYDSITVIVNPNPATPVIVGVESVCLNSLNRVYSSSPSSNWLIWNINGANIYSGQHTNQVHLDVTALDSVWIELTEHVLETGCFATGSLLVIVDTTAVAPPYVNVLPLGNDNDLLCAPQATNVIRWGKMNKVTNLIYLEPSGLTYHNFISLDTSVYYYFVDHGGDGCYTRSYYNYPELVTEVEDVQEVGFWLAPNPVQTELRIMSDTQSFNSLSIENLEGKCVYQGSHWTNTPIDCANFMPGMYFVKIQNGLKSYVIKFLKL